MTRYLLRTALWLAFLVPMSANAQSSDASKDGGATAARAIPFKEDTSLTGQLWHVALVFLAVAGVFVVAVYGYKRLPRFAFNTTPKRLKVVETVRLAPRTALFLVELDRRALLLGLNGQELRLLVPPENKEGVVNETAHGGTHP